MSGISLVIVARVIDEEPAPMTDEVARTIGPMILREMYPDRHIGEVEYVIQGESGWLVRCQSHGERIKGTDRMPTFEIVRATV